jgi:hypothetical protein
VAAMTSTPMTIKFRASPDVILIALQLDHSLAERVFADATLRDLPPCDLVAQALREHYERIDPRR